MFLCSLLITSQKQINMKKLVLSIFSLVVMGAYAQDASKEKDLKNTESISKLPEGWTNGGLFSVNFGQVSLTNWAGGGVNSISLSGLFNVFANWKKESQTWENSLTLGYGVTKLGKADFFKNDDRIDLTSKYGKQAFKNWYYAALLNFRTQMADGFKAPGDTNKISTFMAPGYLLGALGLDYKPNANFTMFIAPITAKYTFVMDQNLADAGAFGVEAATKDALGVMIPGTGHQYRSEFGGYVRIAYNKADILKNVNFTTKVDMFSNYLHNPKNIDINWETIIGLKVNEYITASLSTLLIYDDDIHINVGNDASGNSIIGPRTQFKQVFGAGFSYKF